MKLLTSRDTSKRRDKPEDDLAMLQQVREADPAAGAQYLEHLVLQKRSQVSALLCCPILCLVILTSIPRLIRIQIYMHSSHYHASISY